MFGKRKADTRRWPMLQGRWVHSICHQLQITCNGKSWGMQDPHAHAMQ